MVTNERNSVFGLYVTHVVGEGPFLKICGQIDKPSALMVESLLQSDVDKLNSGVGSVQAAALLDGVICAAKYQDAYYRARIIKLPNGKPGHEHVHFIDFGNRDYVPVHAIRTLENYPTLLSSLPGQATDYILSRVMHPSAAWDLQKIAKLCSILCYTEHHCMVELQTPTHNIIALHYNGADLSDHLINTATGIPVPIQKQQIILQKMIAESIPLASPWQAASCEPTEYCERNPYSGGQSFPTNPSAAMRLQNVQGLPIGNRAFASGYAIRGQTNIPSSVSQRLVVNKTSSRNNVNPKPLSRLPQQSIQMVRSNLQLAAPLPASPNNVSLRSTSTPNTSVQNTTTSPKRANASFTFKSRLLEVGAQLHVCVSYADEGPEVFAVQLVEQNAALTAMMEEINKRPHKSLSEPPMIGSVCLGRMSMDRIIARAVVMSQTGSRCKLFFVDFGDTEMVSYYDIFDIPEEFVKPNVFALRFCLSGVKKLTVTSDIVDAFRELVLDQVCVLRVVAPEGPPLIQYGELFYNGRSVWDSLKEFSESCHLSYTELPLLPLGCCQSVRVSFVDNCTKFYIQLSDNIDALDTIMAEVEKHCEKSPVLSRIDVNTNTVCCARYPDDNSWYRAKIISVNNDKVTVSYVDYGNRQEIDLKELRGTTADLVRLPAQAMICALKGYEDKEVDEKTSNQLEMLSLEKTLNASVHSITNGVMLVDLVDDTMHPPLNVARRMSQLSQPRISRTSFDNTESSKQTSNISEQTSLTTHKALPTAVDESTRSPESGADSEENHRKRGSNRSGVGSKPCTNRNNADPAQNNRFDRGKNERSSGRQPRDDNLKSADWDKSGGWDNPKSSSRDGFKTGGWKETSPRESRGGGGRGSRGGYRDRTGGDRRSNRWEDKKTGNNSDTHSEDSFSPRKPASRGRDTRGDTRNEYRGFTREDSRADTRGDTWQDDKWRGDRNDRNDHGDRNKGSGEERHSHSHLYKKNLASERMDRIRHQQDNHQPYHNTSPRDNKREVRTNFSHRDRPERTRNTSLNGSFGSNHSADRGRKFPQIKQLPNPVPLDRPFPSQMIEPGAQHEVSVTWLMSPDNFYAQVTSLQSDLDEMMRSILTLYTGVKPYNGDIGVNSSVLARFPVDGVLYRATVQAVQPFGKYRVQYVDFGNNFVVDKKDIWQLDEKLMTVPKVAVLCSLEGISPTEGTWKDNPEIVAAFNSTPRSQCVFHEPAEDKFKVSLWNDGVSVAQMLADKNLGLLTTQPANVLLKDEPIDLNIMVGQEVLCRLSHAESPAQFYMQLDLDKARMVQETIAAYDKNNLDELSEDALVSGCHCVVKLGDGIQRAIVQDASDRQSVVAVLPDYGHKVAAPAKDFMVLPSDLSVYFYQSIECTLRNLGKANQLMTDEEFVALKGTKFIICIHEVDNGRLIVTLYEHTSGSKVAVLDDSEPASVCVVCRRTVHACVLGSAHLVHAESLNEVYLQKVADTDKIAQLLDDMYNFYQEEDLGKPTEEFTEESYCAAKSSDGNWYRGWILTVADDSCKIRFIDYGNSETIARDTIKELDAKFYEPFELALVVDLGLSSLKESAVERLLEITADKELQVIVTGGFDNWLASLRDNGEDVVYTLINEQLVEPQPLTSPPLASTSESEPASLPAECTSVYISHIDSPGQFWLQMASGVDKIDELQARLQAESAYYVDLENREIGTMCVAKYTADDMWYRAEILDSDSDITTVRFIDYGNTDVLDVVPDVLKEIPTSAATAERAAMRCSINATPTGTGQWTEESTQLFTELVGDLSQPLDALIVLKDITTYVDLYVNSENVTDKIVTNGFATRSEKTECGDLASCFASHVNTPSEFWIQLESAVAELERVEAAMEGAEEFPELSELEEGVICAAKYPEDGAWYRAQILTKAEAGTEVLFMDYGNASLTTELRSLPDTLKDKPALSRKCALQKPQTIKSWSQRSEIKFNDLAAEGATIFHVEFIASGDISIVELYLEGKSVTDELLSLCEAVTVERLPPVGQDDLASAKLTIFNSPADFYLILDRSYELSDKITRALEDAEEFELPETLEMGCLCACMRESDGLWYRARVSGLCEPGVMAFLIDIGDYITVQELRRLPQDLKEIEPLAKHCTMLSDRKTFCSSVKKQFEEISKGERKFEFEILDANSDPLLVRLLYKQEDMSRLLDVKTKSADLSSSQSFEQQSNVDEDKCSSKQQVKYLEEQTITSKVESNGNSEKDTYLNIESDSANNIDNAEDLLDESLESTNSVLEFVKVEATDSQNNKENESLQETIVIDKSADFVEHAEVLTKHLSEEERTLNQQEAFETLVCKETHKKEFEINDCPKNNIVNVNQEGVPGDELSENSQRDLSSEQDETLDGETDNNDDVSKNGKKTPNIEIEKKEVTSQAGAEVETDNNEGEKKEITSEAGAEVETDNTGSEKKEITSEAGAEVETDNSGGEKKEITSEAGAEVETDNTGGEKKEITSEAGAEVETDNTGGEKKEITPEAGAEVETDNTGGEKKEITSEAGAEVETDNTGGEKNEVTSEADAEVETDNTEGKKKEITSEAGAEVETDNTGGEKKEITSEAGAEVETFNIESAPNNSTHEELETSNVETEENDVATDSGSELEKTLNSGADKKKYVKENKGTSDSSGEVKKTDHVDSEDKVAPTKKGKKK